MVGGGVGRGFVRRQMSGVKPSKISRLVKSNVNIIG